MEQINLLNKKLPINSDLEEDFQMSEITDVTDLEDTIEKGYAIEADNVVKAQGNTFSLVEQTDVKLALRGVSFKVALGECFVMLGSNGAGKTTLFKIMLSELLPTCGKVFIKSLLLCNKNMDNIRKWVGQCPQANSNQSCLTVQEHLELLLEIKNIDAKLRPELIEYKLKELGLIKFRYKEAGKMSGGNQRKLNQAMASVVNPELLFLDEPTSSMDPISRKNINENIVKNKNTSNTIFQCTHIIDEAEFVSDRIAIMINGKIRALGSPSALKKKQGNEQMIWVTIDTGEIILTNKPQSDTMKLLFKTVKIVNESNEVKDKWEQSKTKINLINDWIKTKLDNYQIDEVKFNMFKLKVSKNSKSISGLFDLAQELEDEFNFITTVSIDSVNLEEIFWNMNNQQKSEN